jgi:hypothetical protein
MSDHSPTEFTITVNTRAATVTDREVSYDEIAKIAYPTQPPGGDIVYHITYEDAAGPDGTLKPGHTVKIRPHGTIFNVTPTDKS